MQFRHPREIVHQRWYRPSNPSKWQVSGANLLQTCRGAPTTAVHGMLCSGLQQKTVLGKEESSRHTAGEVDAGQVGGAARHVPKGAALRRKEVDDARREACLLEDLEDEVIGQHCCVRRLPQHHISLRESTREKHGTRALRPSSLSRSHEAA